MSAAYHSRDSSDWWIKYDWWLCDSICLFTLRKCIFSCVYNHSHIEPSFTLPLAFCLILFFFSLSFQLPVADPFLEKVSLSDLGKCDKSIANKLLCDTLFESKVVIFLVSFFALNDRIKCWALSFGILLHSIKNHWTTKETRESYNLFEVNNERRYGVLFGAYTSKIS